MIERKFVKEKLKEFQVKEFIDKLVPGAGHSDTLIKKTPIGDRVVIRAAKPGLVVGRKGENIRMMTGVLKKKFNLDNPQLEIEELKDPFLDASYVAERIVNGLERLGIARFKSVGHKMLNDVMGAGALGIEILFSGKIPGARARTWRFWQCYMKKSGSVSQSQVRRSIKTANLKSGVVGIVVSILPPTVKLPDDIKFLEEGVSVKEKHLDELKAVGGGRVEEESEEGALESVDEVIDYDKEDKELGLDANNEELLDEAEKEIAEKGD